MNSAACSFARRNRYFGFSKGCVICLAPEDIVGLDTMRAKPFESINDGKETERFTDVLRKIVSVPKEDVDKQLEKERRERQRSRDRKRKV